jgi:hypothetical protein
MSNSVVFLLIAVGLSILGSLVVWVHGRPRRPRSSVDHFNAGLRALSSSDRRREPLSGVTVRVAGTHDRDARHRDRSTCITLAATVAASIAAPDASVT